MKSLATLLILMLLAGCASTPPTLPEPSRLFSDATFARAVGAHRRRPAVCPQPGDARLPRQSRYFARSCARKGPAQGLVDALYQKGGLKLEYDSAMTRNAAQAFEARSGNCMSLVIMTAAFAKELGLSVTFQNVVVDQTWRRSGDLYMASSHVNLSLGTPSRPTCAASAPSAR